MTKITENSIHYHFHDEENKITIKMVYNIDGSFSIQPMRGFEFKFQRESQNRQAWKAIAKLIFEATEFALNKNITNGL